MMTQAQKEELYGKCWAELAYSEGHRPRHKNPRVGVNGTSGEVIRRDDDIAAIVTGTMTTREVAEKMERVYRTKICSSGLSSVLSGTASRGKIKKLSDPGRPALWGPA